MLHRAPKIPPDGLTRGHMNSGRDRAWLFPLGGFATAVLAAASFAYLAWHYVPYHAGRLAEVHGPLPVAADWAFAISAWFLRLLPFLVLSAFIAPPFIAVVTAVALVLAPRRAVLQTTGIAFLCFAIFQAVLCAIMLYGIHAAYATLAE
jgi:hypothetical protein